MKIKSMLLFVSAVTLLSGCVDYRWIKPGASEQDRQVQLTACEAQALKDMPPDNVVEDTQTLSSTKKNADDKKTNKDKETYHRMTDANASQRGVLVDNCMFGKGWNKEVVNN
ncbi:hypothetical protein [Raoultella ornithinolytica]|uniref:hypothetical protein n=1 Tax=Raoultella ornithinolytica TaxID=54291 RepID=UPI0021B05745|nr:hypothetical protein [Raoultella ornithinolytica]MCT4737233.1 hypothetical protein [Raoultella ornithinolytica]